MEFFVGCIWSGSGYPKNLKVFLRFIPKQSHPGFFKRTRLENNLSDLLLNIEGDNKFHFDSLKSLSARCENSSKSRSTRSEFSRCRLRRSSKLSFMRTLSGN